MSADLLADASALQRRAAAIGFDWPDENGVWDKLAEELQELRQAGHESPQRQSDEWGDVLFTLINLARHLDIEPTQALDAVNQRFAQRLAYVERHAAGLPPQSDPARLPALERLWQQAKTLLEAGRADEPA